MQRTCSEIVQRTRYDIHECIKLNIEELLKITHALVCSLRAIPPLLYFLHFLYPSSNKLHIIKAIRETPNFYLTIRNRFEGSENITERLI